MLRSQKPKSNLKNSQNRTPNHPSSFELLKTTGARVLCHIVLGLAMVLLRFVDAATGTTTYAPSRQMGTTGAVGVRICKRRWMRCASTERRWRQRGRWQNRLSTNGQEGP